MFIRVTFNLQGYLPGMLWLTTPPIHKYTLARYLISYVGVYVIPLQHGDTYIYIDIDSNTACPPHILRWQEMMLALDFQFQPD